MKVLVGSKALERFRLNRREPKDTDYWVTEDEPVVGGEDNMVMPESIMNRLEVTDSGVATPNTIYTIKLSHLGWDIHWQKTKLDCLWLEAKGRKIIPELYEELVKYWKKLNGKDFLSLSRNKSEFFTDHVTYVYDHDYLHELVAHPNPPMYTKCLKDGEEVLIDKEKFDKMSHEDQVRMFREEITTIAIERWLVNPKWKGKISWYKAYLLSLQKTITSLTKNWATDFLVLNLKDFYKPDYDYFRYVIKTLDLGGNMTDSKRIIEELCEECGYKSSLDDFVVDLASGDFSPNLDYSSIPKPPEYPDYKERKENPQRLEEIKQLRNEWWEKKDEIKKEFFNSIGYEHVMQEGGGEGGSEYCEGVFKLGEKYYKTDWSYYSHHGYEEYGAFDRLVEVKPETKTITVWK